MAAVLTTGSRPEDVAAGQQQQVCHARAMLVPMRDLPKRATIDQEFSVSAELSNCIIVPEVHCCIGRRPTGAALTCIVPETWTAMSSSHGIIRWEDGKLFFKDSSSNGTFTSRDHTTQESFFRLPKGEEKELQTGDYVMFSQWSNNRTNDELLIYQIQAIPDSHNVKFAKRSSSYKKDVNLKSKTPKTNAKALPHAKSVAGSMAPCQHCAKQAADTIAARQELASAQHKASGLMKDLDSFKRKADAAEVEVNELRDQLADHEHLKDKLSQVILELEHSRQEKLAAIAASKENSEKHQINLARVQEAADKAQAENTALTEQLQIVQAEKQKVADQLQQAQQQATGTEAELQAEVLTLQEQNRTLKTEQEERNNSEVLKLKEEHEAEVHRLQKVQLRLEKEAAAWRLKTETVSRTLPDALDKSMIPQLQKAARQCIHKLLQDVNALNDTTASDLFGGTPTNIDKVPCTERAEYAGHIGQSQHTVCFSSPGNLAVIGADVPQTEMFEGATGVAAGNSGPSQEEQGPSVSLRHGFALSQGNPDKNGAGLASKDPASPLLDGFVQSGKGPSSSVHAPAEDAEAAVAGMTTDETRVSEQKSDEQAGLLGRKRLLGDCVVDAADEVGADEKDRVAKVTKLDQPKADHETTGEHDAAASDQDSMEDRSTSALAERLKAIKNHEAVAC